MPGADFDRYLADLKGRYGWLPDALAGRYARSYGTRAERFLVGARRIEDLGLHLGEGLYEAEVEHLVRNEWATSEEDVLWRRTKLGLHVGPETSTRLSAWLQRNREAAEVEVA
jgi:glycerol-3-phosphate dehydrogenase